VLFRSGEVLYPFGYGLSYTSFAYSNAKADRAKVDAKGSVNVSVKVTNTGKMAGGEMVQLYLTHPGVQGAPVRALQGFQRVHLEPGQSQTVTFALSNRQLSIVDEAGKRRVLAGPVQVWVGGGQPVSRTGMPKAAGVATQFTITGEAALPE